MVDEARELRSLTSSPKSRRPISNRSSNRTAYPVLSTPLAFISFFALVSLGIIYRAYTSLQPFYPPNSLAPDARGGGAGSCRMTFMSPSYLRLDGFGREYTRLGAGPWGLYLYREAGWDDEPFEADGTTLALTGTPVVFVPGNAGSFRQVRSLASAASRAWWEVPGVRKKGVGTRNGGRSLDFFTLDFNDDFSAFHGQTLLDQSEYLADCIRYILSLYHHERDGAPDPTSVIVVAHSMGGIVARAAFLHPHYQSGSISTLITIATPHVLPPASVDRGVDRVYDRITQYWQAGYGLGGARSEDNAARDELEDLVLVSISGGLGDITVASESVSLASLLPLNDSHGFTVFTTSIPGLTTPIDHLAMLWCQQLMQIIAQSLLAIVDVRNPRGVVAREERVLRLGERLLGGLESRAKKIEGRTVGLEGLERGAASRRLGVGERLVVREGARSERATFVPPIPPTRTWGSARVFSLLTSSSIGRGKDSAVEVYACATLEDADDLESTCTPLFPSHVSTLPLSPHSPTSPILPAPTEDGTMGFLTVDVAQLEGMGSVVVVVKPGSSWVLAEFGDREKRVQVVTKSAWQLLLGGFKLESFPATPTMVSEIWIPALDTSLLTLKLQVFRSDCQESTSLFAPLVRQYSPLLHESKYFPNVRHASLYTHSSGPYLPSPASPFASSGSRLQLFLDPTCHHEGSASDVAIEIKVDVWATLGSLVMRYRMAAVAFPFSLVMLVVSRQLREYNAGNSFIPFGTALSLFTRDTLFPLLSALTAISFVQSIALSTHLSASDSASSVEPSLAPRWIADLLLGNRSSFFALLAAFITFACVGLVMMEYLVLQCLVGAAAWTVSTLRSRGPASLQAYLTVAEPRRTLATQRIFSMTALLLLVLFFAPYQFAFLVIFLVHLFSTIRSLILAQDTTTPSNPASAKRAWDRYHYSFSILFVMMCLLPINALILVVWVRNLAVGWLAPFSSDHNVLNVVGILLNVEALHSGKMLQRTPGRLRRIVSVALPSFIAAYGFLWGIRYAHSIYPLTNAFFLWLAANNSEALVGAVHEVVVGKRRSSAPVPRENGEVKPTDTTM